jgi:hypothetical protein
MKKKLITAFFLAALGFTSYAAITQIRWGSTGDPLNGLTISWTNTGTADSIQWGYTALFEKGKFVGTRRNSHTSGQYFFSYVFPFSITPSSTLYYKLYDSGAKTWGSQKTFATAPAINSNIFNFLAIGDSRNGTQWGTVSSLANAKKAALTLFNGDIVEVGNSASEWNAWFSSGKDFIENNIIFHAQGNHDLAGTSTYYQNIFDLPKNSNGSELYYSVKYGNVLFVTLNSEEYGSNGGTANAQATWLDGVLKNAKQDPSILWTVISHHRPHFNIGNHSGSSFPGDWKPVMWPVYDNNGVDLILNGHDHNYQRSKPINLKVSSSSPVSKYGSQIGEGRCQIICGGAGAPLYAVDASKADGWAMQKYEQTDNFVFLEVNGCKITITAYRADGSVLDNFVLDKTGTPACIVSGYNQGGENEAQVFHPVKVVPNPANENFMLEYSSPATGTAQVKIFDMIGKEVYSEDLNKSTTDLKASFNVANYAKGVYNVSVIMGKQKDTAILIVK